MNEKLNKKLVKFAKFQWLRATDGDHHWFDEDGDIVSPTDEEGNVIWDMNACFKWLVPKALDEFGEDAVLQLLVEWVRSLIFTYTIGQAANILCLAIEKLIDEEAKK